MLTRLTEWTGEEYRLIRLQGLPQNAAFPRGSAGPDFFKLHHRIERIHVHQTGGHRRHGTSAVQGFAQWCTEQGMPSQPHTFFIPSTMETVDNKFEFYRCWDDDWVTPHTALDPRSVSIVLSGRFRSRHSDDFFVEGPDPEQLEALDVLVNDYLLPRYGLEVSSVRGGFDTGNPTDPGDVLEKWVRELRGESWHTPPAEAPLSERVLRTRAHREAALAELGITSKPGPLQWHETLSKFQKSAGWLAVTGTWNAPTERALRLALQAELSSTV